MKKRLYKIEQGKKIEGVCGGIRNKVFLNAVSDKLEESEEQYKAGKTHNARTVFKELRKENRLPNFNKN